MREYRCETSQFLGWGGGLCGGVLLNVICPGYVESCRQGSNAVVEEKIIQFGGSLTVIGLQRRILDNIILFKAVEIQAVKY